MPPTLESVRAEYREAILEGMARMLWIMAFADWVEELPNDERDEVGYSRRDVQGKDWNDVSPDTPKAADKAAAELAKLYEAMNHDLVDLYILAQEADMGEPFELELSGGRITRPMDQWKLDEAGDFGADLAAMAIGSDVSWFDDHKKFELKYPSFECRYDGDELYWSGGTSDVREVSGKIGRIIVVNQNAEAWAKHRYLLRFGGFTIARTQYLLIYADSFEDALDEMIDWISINEPGSLMDEQVATAYRGAIVEGASEAAAMETAEADMTQGGTDNNYIASEDWTVIGEDPSEEQLLEFSREKNPSGSDFDIAGVTNPETFTAKGERMYKEIAKSHAGDPRAKEIAARTVYARAKQIPGLVANSSRGELENIYVREQSNGWHVEAEFATETVDYGPFATKERAMEMREAVIESALQRNPAGLTAKGERMYEDIKRSYQARHDPRAKEIASRTVLARAHQGTPGLIKKNPRSDLRKQDEAAARAKKVLAAREAAGFETACDDPNCKGWDLFETDRGYGIQACDMCNEEAKREGLPVLFDSDAKHLPEARRRLARAIRQGA